VLIDPSYEMKSDYAAVEAAVEDSLRRFATGVYLIWYPIIGRAQAHQLPRRLHTLALKAQRQTLHATFNIGQLSRYQSNASEMRQSKDNARPGLRASGVFVINPPYGLAQALSEALPLALDTLGQGAGQSWEIDTSN
jgi:23S rRNA (adenine2030-N6)-methyltransferase